MTDSPIDNPFDEHEIIFKDKDGNLKVLRDGKIFDAKEESVGEKSADEPKKTDAIPNPEAAQPRVSEAIESPQDSMEAEAADILKEARVDLGDEALKKRFKNLVVSRFKGIRDIIDAREILAIIESRHKIMSNTENKITEEIPLIQKNEEMITIQREAPLSDGKPEALAGEAQAPFGEKEKLAEARKDILKLIQEMPDYDFLPGITKGSASKAKEVQTSQPQAQNLEKNNIALVEKLPGAMEKELPNPEIIKYTEPKMPEGKMRQDVNLVGPIDELRILDITEFHRIDSDPIVACKRIKEKLATLEQDSFTQLTRGIAAWRQSPIYKLYVDIGRASIMKKTPIEQVINDLKKTAKPYLTVDEFNAIMDLNEQLRF